MFQLLQKSWLLPVMFTKTDYANMYGADSATMAKSQKPFLWQAAAEELGE